MNFRGKSIILCLNYIILIQCVAVQNDDICFAETISTQQLDCSRLSEEEKGRLSFQLMNCHYDRNRRKTIDCPYNVQIKECTSKLDVNYWNIFTQFYVLVQHYCQIAMLNYLQTNMEGQLNYVSYQQIIITKQLQQQIQLISEIQDLQNQLGLDNNNILNILKNFNLEQSNKQQEEEQKQKQMIDQLQLINYQIEIYHQQIQQSFEDLYQYYGIVKYYLDFFMNETNMYFNILINFVIIILIWICTSIKQLINQRSFSYICKNIIILNNQVCSQEM